MIGPCAGRGPREGGPTRAPHVAAHGERLAEFHTQAMRWPVKPLYTPQDLDEIDFDYMRGAGFPGEYPFTRGTSPDGYRTELWRMLQVTGFGTGEDWAKRGRYMLEQGLHGLIIEYDLPFEKLQHLTSVCNAPQPVSLAMILAALEKRGVDPDSFTLQMPNAILIEYTCVGRYIYPPAHGLRIATDVIEYVIRHHPRWVPIAVVSARLYAARGFAIDDVAPCFSFITGVDMDFFESVAKLRAYRKIWAKLMRERYGATNPESLRLRLMASPGTMSLTLQQPLNNIARLGIQLLACALGGGAQTMTSPLHDEAHALPSEEAIAVGAAVQNIVAHETGVADVVDPLGGSYYLEVMTRKIEDAVFAEIGKIDAQGGALRAIETGSFQRALAQQQYDRHRDLESGRRKLVGVNHGAVSGEKRSIELFELDAGAERRQIERLQRVRAERDGAAVTRALARVREAAAGTENLVPPILEAVKVYATHGEICEALRDVFGTHHPDSLTTGI